MNMSYVYLELVMEAANRISSHTSNNSYVQDQLDFIIESVCSLMALQEQMKGEMELNEELPLVENPEKSHSINAIEGPESLNFAASR